MGREEVTFNAPDVIVNKLAIAKTEVADNCKEVPLIATLNKFAVPDNTDEPVKVAVPDVAESVPLTSINDETEKLDAVVMVPVSCKVLKLWVPDPLIVLVDPAIVMVPALAKSEPATDKLPFTTNEVFVETVPLTVRSLKIIPVPEIDFEIPVIVIRPPDN